ncbi:hypothetical protein B0H14DRAFT_2667071 [Mycena olivaceomarginata]|nr:hypothetical protein B0H14DRAFT_2667071 [Mycena olivaceomarginata]
MLQTLLLSSGILGRSLLSLFRTDPSSFWIQINSLSFPFRTHIHVVSGSFNSTSRSGKDMECLIKQFVSQIRCWSAEYFHIFQSPSLIFFCFRYLPSRSRREARAPVRLPSIYTQHPPTSPHQTTQPSLSLTFH